MFDRRILFMPMLLAALGHPMTAAAQTCEEQCYESYRQCNAGTSCYPYIICPGCDEELQYCLDYCYQPQSCTTDTCTTCGRPAAAVDTDADLVPDQLEYDLAHRFFPNIYLQHANDDLGASYLGTGWAIPVVVKPRLGGICNEDRECLEIRYGLAYRYDAGDPTFGTGHFGDAEFYAALVQRTSPWSTASTNASAWQMIRDFTAAHWEVLGDSSVVGAYGYCAPACHSWNNDGSTCQAHSQCHWFPGLCSGTSSQLGTICSNLHDQGECYFSGCTWHASSCNSTSTCYSTSPRTAQKDTYASEGKHGLYHSDGECSGGGFLAADDCPTNAYDMRVYKTGKLQNVGNDASHLSADTVMQYPDGCGLYDVWSGAAFGESTSYRHEFLFVFDWNLPAQ